MLFYRKLCKKKVIDKTISLEEADYNRDFSFCNEFLTFGTDTNVATSTP